MHVYTNRIRWCLLMAILWGFFYHTTAQPATSPYYNFKRITTHDGLSSNNVNAVCRDVRGFLWIGTDRGVQRYNGSFYQSFRHLNADSNSLINDYIHYILQDKQENIWIATKNGLSMFSYRNGRITNYAFGFHQQKAAPLVDVFWIFEDSRANIWIGARNGLFRYDRREDRFINYPPVNLPDVAGDHFVRVGCIAETSEQELVFTMVDGFVIMDRQGHQQHFPVPEPRIKPINYLPVGQVFLLKDHPNEIWVTPNLNGLYKYERNNGKWTNYRSHGITNDYVKGCLNWNPDTWLLGGDVTCLFNHRTGTFQKIFDPSQVYYTRFLYQEAGGSIWFASSLNGLIELNPSQQLFRYTQLIPGSFSDKLFYYDTAAQSVYGLNMYFNTGIVKFNLRTQEVIKDSIPYFKPLVSILNDMVVDEDQLYLATEKGFWKYNLLQHQLDSIVLHVPGLSSQDAFFFHVLVSGDLIYFTGRFGSGGPFVYNKRTKQVTDLNFLRVKSDSIAAINDYQPAYSPNPTMPHGQVNKKDIPVIYRPAIQPSMYSFCLAKHQHQLYVGMNISNNVYVYNESSTSIKTISIPAAYNRGKPSSILSMAIDQQQNLWCGTAANGIYVYHIPTGRWVKHISQPEGYFPELSSQLLCDDDGVVWCNTTEGLFAFNPINFRFKQYGSGDGLGNENNGGNLVLLPDHQLLFNNINKPFYEYSYGVIQTRQADTSVQMVPISISAFNEMGKPFLADTLLDNVHHIVLPPLHHTFSLTYAAVSLSEGKNMLYRYRLAGAEEGWHEAGSEKTLSYINLSPGHYVLHIKSQTRNGSLIGRERQIQIDVLPAWYQTRFFQVSMFLLLLLCLYILFRYYLQQQLKKQQLILEKEKALEAERQRIAADMHDDVGAGLSRIRYITSAMKEGRKLSTDDMDKILSLSDESVEKMNEIIWSLNQGNQPMSDLFYYIRSQCAEMVLGAGLEFSCELPETFPSVTLPWSQSRNIYLVVKEAVNNAIKHAQATCIRLQVQVDNPMIIEVADNGIGFQPGASGIQGNGLKHFQKRCADMNSQVHIGAAEGQGTHIRFSIPFE